MSYSYRSRWVMLRAWMMVHSELHPPYLTPIALPDWIARKTIISLYLSLSLHFPISSKPNSPIITKPFLPPANRAAYSYRLIISAMDT